MTRKEQLIAVIEQSSDSVIEHLWQTLEMLPISESTLPLKKLFQVTQALPQTQTITDLDIEHEIDIYRSSKIQTPRRVAITMG